MASVKTGSGRLVSTPASPTSVQGRLYAGGMRSLLGTRGRGRGNVATYQAPRRGRA